MKLWKKKEYKRYIWIAKKAYHKLTIQLECDSDGVDLEHSIEWHNNEQWASRTTSSTLSSTASNTASGRVSGRVSNTVSKQATQVIQQTAQHS